MSWRARAITGAFTSDTEKVIATKGVNETVLTSLGWTNDTALPLDITIRLKRSGVYSGEYRQNVPPGAPFNVSEMPEYTLDVVGDEVMAIFTTGQVFTGRFVSNLKDWL